MEMEKGKEERFRILQEAIRAALIVNHDQTSMKSAIEENFNLFVSLVEGEKDAKTA
jgi:hypothetical protein